jgi:hypothetical protein
MIVLDQKRKQKEAMREADRLAREQERGSGNQLDNQAATGASLPNVSNQHRPSMVSPATGQAIYTGSRRPSANPNAASAGEAPGEIPYVPAAPLVANPQTMAKLHSPPAHPAPAEQRPPQQEKKKKGFFLFSCCSKTHD